MQKFDGELFLVMLLGLLHFRTINLKMNMEQKKLYSLCQKTESK